MEHSDDIRREAQLVMTMFIQDTGCWWLARDRHGDAVGILYVPEFPEEIIIGVRVIGKDNCSFELLNDAQVGTYREMELVPDLRYMDRREVSVKTVSGGEVLSYQLNYCDPSQDYDPRSDEARTVTIPPGALKIGGKLPIKAK